MLQGGGEMDWVKRYLRGNWPFLLLGAATGTIIAMSAIDTIRLKECNEQIVKLRQELALTQKELQACREMFKAQ
jgi:hypothetical protein